MGKRPKSSETGALLTDAPVLPSEGNDVAAFVAELPSLDQRQLCLCWRNHLGGVAPAHLPKWLLVRVLAYRVQATAFGGLDAATSRRIRGTPSKSADASAPRFARRAAVTREGAALRPGALIVREWKGELQRVTILHEGFAWNGGIYGSLSKVAKAITGASWNGHRFFGLKKLGEAASRSGADAQ
jgi:hypothetical protein